MAEKLIELDSVELAAAVFGSCDENIRLLEKEFSVTAVCRGTQVKLTGEAEGVTGAANAIDAMLTLLENHTPIEEQTVRYCISLARSGEDGRVQELTENFIAITAKGRPVRPKTLGQKEYLKAIQTHPITFGVGPAGTGKTYLAVAMAVKAFKSKDVERIILTRPAVEAGEKLGFLPGDLQNKVDPYLACMKCLGRKPSSGCWRSRPLRLPRWPICAAERWTMPSSFWMKPRTPARNR